MKIFSIIGLAAIMALFLITPAGAAQVPVVNYDFSLTGENQWASSETYSGQTGWVETGSWSRDSNGALLLEAGKSTQSGYFSQVINFSGVAGPINLSFETKYLTTTDNAITGTFALYGSTTQPASNSSWSNAAAFGNLLGSSDLITNSNQSTWFTNTLNVDSPENYSWYTIIFYGSITGDKSPNTQNVMIDNVRLDVTPASAVPIPPAAWLLGSGLIGLVAIRRRLQN